MSLTAAGVADAEREAYWDAVVAADVRSARAVATACLARGVALPDVLRSLVTSSQARVGGLWAANAWTVAQEHAATAVSEAVVGALAGSVPDGTGPLVLVACAEREWHALPAMVVTQTLRAAGVRAEFLGPSTSPDQLVARILDAGPSLVLLSASVASSLGRVRRQVEAVRGTGTPVVVGGHAFGGDAARAEGLGATAYATCAEEVVGLLERLPHHVPAAPPLRGPGALEAPAIQELTDEITADVLAHPPLAAMLGQPTGAPDHWATVLATFVPHVVGCLVGALLADDPAVVATERAWLADVLDRRGGDPRAVAAVWEALAERLREFPEALRLLE